MLLNNTLHTLRVICRNEFSTQASSVKRKYDLFSAVCLERHPIVTRPMNDLEKKYKEHLETVEFRNSIKNDFELQQEWEIKEAEMIKKGLKSIDLDKPTTETTIDIEEAGMKAVKEFPFASRITEADELNVVNSLNRKLDKNLLLLVEQKVGENLHWIPPQSLWVEGETMREAAERALKELCGDEIKVRFYGNAPVGMYKYDYPKKMQEEREKQGAKVFYFLAKYIKGTVPEKLNYQWLDRQEMKTVLPNRISRNVSHFLIPE